MNPYRTSPALLAFAVALVTARAAAAQGGGRELELRVGRWDDGRSAATYEIRSAAAPERLLSTALTLTGLVDRSLGRRRAFYGLGWEVEAWRGRYTFGPYALAGAALGLSTDTGPQRLAVLWSVGGGLEWRPWSRVGLGLEGRFRDEDRGPRGFWSRGGDPRKGLSLSLGLAIGLGHGGGAYAARAPRLPPEPPASISGNAADVVRTAIGAIGTPYQWGGTAANGFDCSGLVQYAYGQHGIRLPRTSHDQSTAGTEVTPVLEALQPGDVLLFSARPGGGVTHVGMYVGEHKFIHSSSSGVRISVLDQNDPEGVYWMPRWVGARRILP